MFSDTRRQIASDSFAADAAAAAAARCQAAFIFR
jgi:hypothetical protein